MTSLYTITDSDWTDLGPGPLQVEVLSMTGVYVAAAASKPSAADLAHVVEGSAQREFATTARLYARAVGQNATAVIIATPLASALRDDLTDLAAIAQALRALANPYWVDPVSGRLRVLLDSTGGSNTLQYLTSMDQIARVPANSFVFDAMMTCWANTARRAIT